MGMSLRSTQSFVHCKRDQCGVPTAATIILTTAIAIFVDVSSQISFLCDVEI